MSTDCFARTRRPGEFAHRLSGLRGRRAHDAGERVGLAEHDVRLALEPRMYLYAKSVCSLKPAISAAYFAPLGGDQPDAASAHGKKACADAEKRRPRDAAPEPSEENIRPRLGSPAPTRDASVWTRANPTAARVPRTRPSTPATVPAALLDAPNLNSCRSLRPVARVTVFDAALVASMDS